MDSLRVENTTEYGKKIQMALHIEICIAGDCWLENSTINSGRK